MRYPWHAGCLSLIVMAACGLSETGQGGQATHEYSGNITQSGGSLNAGELLVTADEGRVRGSIQVGVSRVEAEDCIQGGMKQLWLSIERGNDYYFVVDGLLCDEGPFWLEWECNRA